jgi:hypothetical protein
MGVRAKMATQMDDLRKLNNENAGKQMRELQIELKKRGKTDQEIEEQIGLIDNKAQEFNTQLNKFLDSGSDYTLTYDTCGNMCPTCVEATIIPAKRTPNMNTPTIRFCMNGFKKAREASDLFRNTGVTPSPMMTVPPPLPSADYIKI